MPEAFSPHLGDLVADRFELKTPLRHSGAMQAFVAFDRQTGRDSTLMLFDPVCAHPSAWSAFAHLIGTATAASIPGLILPQSVSPARPNPPWCISAPPVDGDLDRLRAQDGPLPWHRGLVLGERLVEILSQAHAATQVAHRALTPSRCIVSARDEVQVLDYGVAEIELGEGYCDNPGYHAPEQQHAPGDQRSDVYTVAAILFELISGKHPATTELPQLRLLVPVPFNVNILLARALSQDPEHRYPDLFSMRATMREVLGLAPIPRTELAKVGPGPARPPPPDPATRAQANAAMSAAPRAHDRERPPGDPPPTRPARPSSTHTPARPPVPDALQETTLRLPDVEPARPHPIPASASTPTPAAAGHWESRPQLPVLADVTLAFSPPISNRGSLDPRRDEPLTEKIEVLGGAPSHLVAEKTEVLGCAPFGAMSQKTEALDEQTHVLSRRPPLHPPVEKTEALGRPPIAPSADKTEALARPLRPPADKIEILGRPPTDPHPDEKTEALPRRASGGTMQNSTLELSRTAISPHPVPPTPSDDITLAFMRPSVAPPPPAILQVRQASSSRQSSSSPRSSGLLIAVNITLAALMLLVIVCNIAA